MSGVSQCIPIGICKLFWGRALMSHIPETMKNNDSCSLHLHPYLLHEWFLQLNVHKLIHVPRIAGYKTYINTGSFKNLKYKKVDTFAVKVLHELCTMYIWPTGFRAVPDSKLIPQCRGQRIYLTNTYGMLGSKGLKFSSASKYFYIHILQEGKKCVTPQADEKYQATPTR